MSFLELLKQANFTQANFAKELGLKQQTISKWCKNKSKPNIATLQKISKLLNCNTNEILNCFTDKKQKKE